MMELLDAGFTTVQSGGDDNAGILELKKMVASGAIKGPRIIASGRVPTDKLPDEAAVRAAVDKVVKDGADSIAEVHYPAGHGPTILPIKETKNLAGRHRRGQEAGRRIPGPCGEPAGAVGRGPHRRHQARPFGAFRLALGRRGQGSCCSRRQVPSSTGFGVPVFGVFNQDNKPTFRDGKPWPEGIIAGQGTGQEAGYKPVNLRTLYDNGVKVDLLHRHHL